MSALSCLVTGGTGFLGRYVTEVLSSAGRQVSVLSRRVTGSSIIQADLTTTKIDLREQAFDEVYHLAGLAHQVPTSIYTANEFIRVNLQGTRALLESIEKSQRLPSSLVFASSVAVYGLDRGVDLDEDTPRKATDPYGVSKCQAEDLLLNWGDSNRVKIGIVRLPLLFGFQPPGNLGRMIQALRKGQYCGIGDGNARRSMVLADDVAKIMPTIAGVGGIYHLTDGMHPSFVELENALCIAMEISQPRRIPIQIAKGFAISGSFLEQLTGKTMPFNMRILSKMTNTLTFSDARARASLGWSPAKVIERVGAEIRGSVDQ